MNFKLALETGDKVVVRTNIANGDVFGTEDTFKTVMDDAIRKTLSGVLNVYYCEDGTDWTFCEVDIENGTYYLHNEMIDWKATVTENLR